MAHETHNPAVDPTQPTREGAVGRPGSLEGRHIGRYQVLSLLGTGGMGEVYVGRDPLLGRTVAIKRLHPGDVRDNRRVSRLRKEAELHGGLSHPNIVPVYDFVSQDGADHIIAEYIDGQSLRGLTETARPSFGRAVEILLGVARGLAFAHEHGIVHRDLKTENVLIGADRSVKITDFGISRSLTPDPSTKATQPGALVGTFQMMSPEQSLGEDVDTRSDLFSFGIMAYEVLAGRPPFEGRTVNETLHNIRTKPHIPLRELAPQVPEELSQLVDWLLTKNREGRPKSAKIVIETLERVWAGVPHGNESARVDSCQVAVVYLAAHIRGTAMGDQLAAFHDEVRRAAQEHGAEIIYGAGDEALLCLGYRRAHENNTLVGARLVNEVFRLKDTDANVDIRAAIDVGQAHIRPGPPALFLGAPINGAMNIGRAAAPGEFLASAHAQGPLARHYRLDAKAPLAIDGERLPQCYQVVEALMPEHVDAKPLVGRDHELEGLRRGWNGVQEQWKRHSTGGGMAAGRVVALEGEAGIGKSRLVGAFIDEQPMDVRCLFTHATPEGRHRPFEPFRRLLAGLPELQRQPRAMPRRSDIERWVRPTSPDDAELVAAVAHVCGVADESDQHIVRALTGRDGPAAVAQKLAWLLFRMAEEQPLVIVVEDLHWTDHASRHVINELVTQASQLPIFVVLTYRPEFEPTWSSDKVTTVPLSRLSDRDARRFIEQCVDASRLSEAERSSVLDKAEGVPFYLEELCRDFDPAGIPATARDAMRNRLQALPPHTRRTAELAAAIGREVPSELLIAVVGRDRGEVSADVEALERRGVVRQQGFARNRRLIVFSHALMHEAIYDGLDDAGRLQLHVQIVRTLQSSFADWADERPELFAHHFEASNMLVEAVDYWQRAGARASHMWSHETAYRHYQHVLDLIPRLPRDRRDSTERATRQSLGASLVLLKGIGSDELDANNARLAELAQEGDAPPTWQELWMQYVGAYAVCSLPAMHAADALLEARVATTADDDEAAPFHRYFLALTRGMTYVHHGLLSQAREQLGAARTMREPLLPQLTSLFEQSAAVAPSVYLTWVDMLAGDLDAAWKTQVDEETAYPTGSSTQLNALAFGYTIAMIVEDHDRARARIKTVLEEGESVLLPGHTAIARLGAELISLRESLRGVSARPLTADPRSRDAAIASLAAMWKELMSWHAGALRASSVVHCAMIAEVCVDVLRHPEADAALRDAALAQARTAIQFALDVLSDEGGEAMHRYYSSELDRVRARLALWQGDATAAQALLDSARKRCARVAVEGGVEPKLLSDRIARTAEELSGT